MYLHSLSPRHSGIPHHQFSVEHAVLVLRLFPDDVEQDPGRLSRHAVHRLL